MRLAPDVRSCGERLSIPARRVLYGPGDALAHLYFPTGGVLSLVARSREDETAEVAMIGSEGCAPIPALLCVRRSRNLLVQQIPGEVIRVPVAAVARAMRRDERIQRLVHRYAAYSLRVAHQAAACNALHSVLARTARWLLAVADRAAAERFCLTQQMLGQMLGTPRQTINVALRTLARQKLVMVRRGEIRLPDRRALERISCPCYRLIGAHHRELLR